LAADIGVTDNFVEEKARIKERVEKSFKAMKEPPPQQSPETNRP
jgi:hypothetical protein